MKIKKEFLNQIIKEELRSVLYGDPIKQKVIRLFVIARDDRKINKLIYNLNKIGVIPHEAITLLNKDEEDSNFYIRCVEIHNEIVKRTGKGKEARLDAFAQFPRLDHESERSYDKNFLIPPKSAEAYVGEPVHLYKKNWVQE